MSLLEIDNLSIAFGDQTVLDGISLTIAAGERFGLVGESGSGKTMTALAIAGLLPPGAQMTGQIRLDDVPLPSDEKAMARLRGKAIGMVFQEPMTALNPLMRAGAQVEEAVQLGLGRAASEDDIARLFAEVGLEAGHVRRYPHELSGGQRQRVMIAMALASEPELLIADEPTSALDLITQRRILDLIATICERRHMALLFISHDLKAVNALCSRVLVLRRGVMVESGPVAEVFAQPVEDYTKVLVRAATPNVPLTGRERAGAREEIEDHPLPTSPVKGEVLAGGFGEIVPVAQDGTLPLAGRAGEGETASALLTVDALTRRFHQPGKLFRPAPPLVAVNAVSFAIGRGQSVALVGPSGCGKTTLARMVVGLDRASDGEMTFEGQRYTGSDLPKGLRRDISMVFQDPFGSFDPRLPVEASVGEPLRLEPGLSTEEKRTRVAEAVEAVRLSPDMLSRYPHEFSGGQRQRLAIARALVTRPKLVVLDEPVSALDMSVRADVLALLARLRDDFGLAYLIISHDLDMVAMLAERVLVMERGRIVESGAPEAIFEAPQHELTRALIGARLAGVVAGV